MYICSYMVYSHIELENYICIHGVQELDELLHVLGVIYYCHILLYSTSRL